MRSFYSTIFLAILLSNSGLAQFQRSYGTERSDYGLSLDFTRFDKGYVLGGYTAENFLGSGDATLIKTDDSGNPIWSAVYGGQRPDLFYSVRHLGENPDFPAYVATGYTNSFGFGSSDVYLVGTDLNGTPLFSSVFGGDNRDISYCVQPIRDTEFGSALVIVGETYSFPSLYPGSNVYVIKTDLFGNLIQSVVIGGDGDQRGYWIEQTRDGGFIIAGSTTDGCTFDPFSTNRGDILIIKLNPDLSIAWTRVFGGVDFDDFDVAYSIIENRDESFTATGLTRTFGASNNGDAFLLNLDPAGNFNWMKTYGLENAEAGVSLKSHEDDAGDLYYTVLGYTNSDPDFRYDAYMFQTDFLGNLLWTRTYGLDGYELGYELTKNLDPGFAFTGYTTSLGAGSSDIYFVETDINGKSNSDKCEREIEQKEIEQDPCITEGLQFVYVERWEPVKKNYKRIKYAEDRCSTFGLGAVETDKPENDPIKVFPNPGQDKLNLTLTRNFNGGEVELLHATTNKVLLKSTISDAESTTLDIKDIPRGMYIIQVRTKDGKLIQRRFIKEED